MKMKYFAYALLSMMGPCSAFADISTPSINAPLPTSCITGVFSKDGSSFWSQVSLKLTNNCGKDVDFQDSNMTFKNGSNLSTSFWGDFSPLSYPDNVLQISSQPIGTGFLSSFGLHFPSYQGARSILHDKESFVIRYGTSTPNYDPASLIVYINGGPPILTGEIALTNSTAKPANVAQNYALVDIIFNGQKVNTVQVPWGQTFNVASLTPGAYNIQPQTLTDSNQNTYQGSAVPNSLTVVANQKTSSVLSYQLLVQRGTINVQTQSLPAALTGYTALPNVTFTRNDTGASLVKSIPWNTVTPVSTLDNNVLYQLATPVITFNNTRCVGSFNPSSLLSRNTAPLTTVLSYACSSILVDKVNINVLGVPCDVTSISVALKPSDGSASLTKSIAIIGGIGSDSVNLTDGVSYSVAATDLDGYNVAFNLQPLVARVNVTEIITYSPHALRLPRINR